MERLQIHRQCGGTSLGFSPEYPGRPFEKLRLPLRDLIGVNVELLRQLGQRLLALQSSQCHFRLECRAVVPARSFRHRLSPDPQPSWPLSGRNSTHRPVQIRGASSEMLEAGRKATKVQLFELLE